VGHFQQRSRRDSCSRDQSRGEPLGGVMRAEPFDELRTALVEARRMPFDKLRAHKAS
jgi:hypothetical protein